MKLTHFFVLLLLFSISLFVFLKPQELSHLNGKEIAQLEIEDFIVYELTKKGVESVLSGTIGRQYSAYYEVENVHYIENKNRLDEHLYADRGRFEKNIAYLNDNVRYFREDGLSFESSKAIYDTKKELLHVPTSFILTQNENVVYGNELHYNTKTGKIRAQNIDASYYIEDKE